MARYIDREKLLELINEDCKYKNPTNEYTKGCNEVCDWAIKTIKTIPTADVVKVVRCKDCIHRNPEDKTCDCSFQAKGGIFPMGDDDFCSYGEMLKEDEKK